MGAGNVNPSTAFPPEFIERIHLIDPENAKAILSNLSGDGAITARVNTLRTERDAVLGKLHEDSIMAEPIRWEPDGIVVPRAQREQLTHHELVTTGDVYIQGSTSWLTVRWLDPQPGEEVLDLAAAPGGKSLHIAARMENRGRLACVEPVRSRFFRLKANLERGGVSIHALYQKDGRSVGNAVPERFDRVLLDAPCSSESRFIMGEPDSYAHWSLRKIREQSKKQRGLIRSAFRALKPEGTLIYSTCSFAPEENEVVLTWLQKREPEMRIVPLEPPTEIVATPGLTEWGGKPLHPLCARALRVLPRDSQNALFIARIKKGASV